MVNVTVSDTDFDVESAMNYNLQTLKVLIGTVESLVISNENILELGPGEDRETRHILLDEKCEELAFPETFFKGKFIDTFPRENYLTPTKYFNQRLLNYSQKFASNSDYIFFVLQQKTLKNQMNMTMKKVLGRVTAGMFGNYEETVKHFVSNNEGFIYL